jgi:membrane-bound lytic murein transglycosylase A
MRCAILAVAVIGCGGASDPVPQATAAPATATPAPAKAAEPAPAVAPCAQDPVDPTPVHDALTLTKAAWKDLPAWTEDHFAEAVPSLLQSCIKIGELKDSEPVGVDGHGGLARQWRRACAAAKKLATGDDAAARAMFEAEFTPFVAAGKAGTTGKLTAYYVAEMHASKKKSAKYQYPVLGRPADLVMIDLGLFTHDAHGRRVWGRLDSKGEIVPYPTRKEIRTGALGNKGLELMYVDDPVDLLFAQIEGSAKAIMDDGSTVWLEFSGKNGRAYRGVGAVLKALNAFPPGSGGGTMQNIRKWFHDNPTRFDEIADQSESYVFFQVSKLPGAVGSQKVVLTPKRSAAIDRAFIAFGTPLWIEGRAPVPGKIGTSEPWHHLLIAQDTGGGILGAVRADIYWGDDRDSEEIGGRMGGAGRYWVLLPNGVTK